MLIEIKEKELNRIMEALVFASCPDACSDWSIDDAESMMAIAEKLSYYPHSFENSNLYLSEFCSEEELVTRAKRLGIRVE